MEEGLWTRWNTEGERKGKDYTGGWREREREREGELERERKLIKLRRKDTVHENEEERREAPQCWLIMTERGRPERAEAKRKTMKRKNRWIRRKWRE